MKQLLTVILAALLLTPSAKAQENLQKGAESREIKKTFTTIKELPITSVKNQYRSGTCWDYGTLGFFESEILNGLRHALCAHARIQPVFARRVVR